MYRIDNASSVATLPTEAAAATGGYWTNGDPIGGIPPTIIDADWLNNIQEEFMSILTAAGVTPVKTAHNQVLTALQSIFGTQNVFTGGTTTGSANAQVIATVSPAATSFTNGQSVAVTAGFANTGSMTFGAGGETPIVVKKQSGPSLVVLASGDVALGASVTFTKNTAGACWVLNEGIAYGTAAFQNVGFFCQVANNLSDVVAATARGNLGAAASGANTDISSLSAPAIGAATATTQSGTDNTTKVSTTAQTQAALAAYKGTAKAWVRFNSSGTIASGMNVSSVTVNATGDYTINYTSSIGSTTYAATGSTSDDLAGGTAGMNLYPASLGGTDPTATTTRMAATASGVGVATAINTVVVFGV